MDFTPDEQKILARYFTNSDLPIFALTNLPEVIKGALFSRYSRTSKDLRHLFLEEFFSEGNIRSFFDRHTEAGEGSDPLLEIGKAEDFYERILVGYGDDSVGELGGAHVAIEGVSMLATKSIEEHRIGLSPLEKSTRYVYFDQKVGGAYQFCHDPKLLGSPYRDVFLSVTEELFDTYSKIVHEIQPFLRTIIPGDESEAAYRFSIRAKACDLVRGLLPLSTKTNMGVYGNGRAFEYLLTHLFNNPVDEVVQIACALQEELRKVIPAFIKRAGNERGEQTRTYLTTTEKGIISWMDRNTHGTSDYISEAAQPGVVLAEYDRYAVEKVIAGVLYERGDQTFYACFDRAMHLSPEEKRRIFASLAYFRKNRHHKPFRAYELANFSFEITADWGVYKDLMRHRILTRLKKPFTAVHGYVVPEELEVTGFASRYRAAMDRAVEAYERIKVDFPYEAQYLVTHGSYNSFFLKMNLREAVHFVELRSSPQGHPAYRSIAQDIARRITEKMPLVAEYLFPFVDYKDYELERLEAFRKIEKKANDAGMEAFQD